MKKKKNKKKKNNKKNEEEKEDKKIENIEKEEDNDGEWIEVKKNKPRKDYTKEKIQTFKEHEDFLNQF